jgi:hypothetical protein
MLMRMFRRIVFFRAWPWSGRGRGHGRGRLSGRLVLLAVAGWAGRVAGWPGGWVARWPGGLVAVADVYIDGSDM